MHCEVFWKKDLICIIDVNFISDTVDFENFSDKWPILPFGKKSKACIQDFYDFVEDRIMPKSRFNCKEVLDEIGMDTYDSIELLKYNHGMSVEDPIWIRFDGEEVDYDKVIKPFISR